MSDILSSRGNYRDKFFSGFFVYMEDSLNGLLDQRRAITQNIANVNNPNYHPVHVSFQSQLEKMYHDMWRGDDNPDGLQISPIAFDFDPEFKAENGPTARLEPVITRDYENRVDLNHEMGELYKNQMLYHVISENGRPTYGRDVLDVLLK